MLHRVLRRAESSRARRANCRWPSRLARQREREARLLGDSRPARRSVILNGNEAQQSPGRRFTLAHELGH